MSQEKQETLAEAYNLNSIGLTGSEKFAIDLFTKAINLHGDYEDRNSKEWFKEIPSHFWSTNGNNSGDTNPIEGEWFSRWNNEFLGAKGWVYGIARLLQIGNRVYILHKDPGNVYLIEARCQSANYFIDYHITENIQGQDKRFLVGKYTNLGNQSDSSPWVGLIVSSDRIDGQWIEGRWDLRRKNI